ncbi:MAG: family 16 glycoside hydrolase [Planctomycetota bacterium]|jgi:hypothetical protein
MNKNIHLVSACLILSLASLSAHAADAPNPYIGRWALTIPGGGAGWLGVTQEDGYLDASVLWGGGSVVPVDWVTVEDGELYVLRLRKVERKDRAGKVVRTQMLPEYLVAKVDGDLLELTQLQPRRNGLGVETRPFTGKRIPPLPPRPDLSKAKYGTPIVLFDGTDMKKWELIDANRRKNGWSIRDGALVNNPVQPEGGRHISYGNLRTINEFEDFKLDMEVNVPRRGNSGVYLRGIYEIQVNDSYGRQLDSHNMGGVYSRIAPTVNAEKPAGQWQTMSMTLLDRHVTVELNGKVIIDNQPLLGCTGGALWSDEFKAGPIYLQGDHTAISYRNIVLTPIIRDPRQTLVFEDHFDSRPAAGWRWLREDTRTWRMKEDALEIRVEPGVARTVKNALVRRAPDRSRGRFAIDVTVTNNTKPTQQYEQAGITWYNNGKPVFKLVKELVDGQLMIIPGRKPMTSKTVQLRLIVTADSFIAQFRPGATGEFQTAATGKLPPPGDDEVSIQCYNGPADADHWIRFDDFRILQLPQ